MEITNVNLEPLCLLYQIEAGPTHKFRQNFEFVLFLTQILGSVSPPYHFQLIWAVIKPGMRLEMARPEEISGHGNQPKRPEISSHAALGKVSWR